jgi:hypothetical protein
MTHSPPPAPSPAPSTPPLAIVGSRVINFSHIEEKKKFIEEKKKIYRGEKKTSHIHITETNLYFNRLGNHQRIFKF